VPRPGSSAPEPAAAMVVSWCAILTARVPANATRLRLIMAASAVRQLRNRKSAELEAARQCLGAADLCEGRGPS
jgi:hypothetical protein